LCFSSNATNASTPARRKEGRQHSTGTVRTHAGRVPRAGRCSTGGPVVLLRKEVGYVIKNLLFAAWGYSDGPTRRRGSEEGLVPTGVAQTTDCGNGGETKGQ